MKAFLKMVAMFFRLSLLSPSIIAQFPQLPQVLPPSPNAGSLGVYGQIPVSLFSGLPQISIPIGEVNAGNISVPISLNYHGGGIRPDIHSGWVGLGWDLNAGGVISRRVNGLADEYIAFDNPYDVNLYSYYYKFSKADNPNWASIDTFVTYFNFDVNASTSPIYPSPDEFIFNFGQYSGSFYYNTKGQWQVKSNQPVKINVKELLSTTYNLPKQINGRTGGILLGRIFYQFTLTTPDGTQYVFGGTPESLEFTRSASSGPLQDGSYNTVVPMSWYLTSVTSNTGQQIILNYQRDGIQATLSSFINLTQYTITNQSGQSYYDISDASGNIINPSYLSSITAPNQTVKFARSASTELSFNYLNYLNPALLYPDLSKNETNRNDIINAIKWLKLDSISFYSDNKGLLKKFSFNYPQLSNSRLILKGLTESGSAGESKPPYLFNYESTSLPVYNSQMLDHWGYYNGRNYFANNPVANNQYSVASVNDYALYRNSDPGFAKAGILNSIKYPTGGVSILTWEPHDFSYVVKPITQRIGSGTWQISIILDDTIVNSQTAGMRIRAITDFDSIANSQIRKEYFYKKDYNTGGTSSSGILAGVPKYLDAGDGITPMEKSWFYGTQALSYWFWHDYPVEQLSFTEGNNVTYSEVTVKNADGSYTINTFSNHDHGTYLDKPPYAGLYLTYYQWKLDPGNSMALERGKLLTKTDYNSNNVKVRKSVYDYDTASSRLNEAVKIITLTPLRFGSCNTGRISAYFGYSFPQYLISQTDSLWNQNGGIPIVTKHHYGYNKNFRLRTADTTYDSKSRLVCTSFQYPPDMLSSPDAVIYQSMTNANNILPVITQTTYVANNQINLIRTNYYAPISGIYVPKTVVNRVLNNPEEIRLVYSDYDNKGNMLSVSKSNDITTSYILDYKFMYPVAEIKNASQSEIAYTSFEADGTGNWTGIIQGNILNEAGASSITGNKCYQLNGNVIEKMVNPALNYTISFWTKGGSYSVNYNSSSPIKSIVINNQSWLYYEFKTGGVDKITLRGDGVIDELRLYPTNAQMTTYTYDPLIGITSVCDINNKITYYEYDAFNRLSLIRDQDKNILKKICYNYAGQQENCLDCSNKTPDWQNTGRRRCQQNSNNQPTCYMEYEQQDLNQCSITYNQIRWAQGENNYNCCLIE